MYSCDARQKYVYLIGVCILFKIISVTSQCNMTADMHPDKGWILYMSISSLRLNGSDIISRSFSDSDSLTNTGVTCDPAVYYYDSALTKFTYIYDESDLKDFTIQPPDNVTMLNITCKHEPNITVNTSRYGHLQSFAYRCMLGQIPPLYLQGLRNLYVLDLSNNNLTSLPVGAFSDLPQLLILMLNNNPLVQYASDIFCDIQRLFSLNMINSFSSFPSSLFGKPNGTTSCHLHNIQLIRLNLNRFKYLPAHAFHQLNSLNDNELLLRNCSIKAISPDAFKDLHRVKYIALDNNAIQNLTIDMIKPLNYLIYLSVSGNNIESLSASIFKSNYHLGFLDMSKNGLKTILGSFRSEQSLWRHIKLSSNHLETVGRDIFSSQKGLRWLELQNNKIKTIDRAAFKGLDALDKLDLGYNRITRISPGLFEDLNNLTTLHINNNYIANISPFDFNSLSSLRHLCLRSNRLGQVGVSVYKTWTNIEYLDLGQNNISILPDDETLNMASLQCFVADHNNISVLTTTFIRNLPKLKNLTLHGNRLQEIDMNVLNSMPSSLEYVSLYDNPWKCDCGIRSLQEWCSQQISKHVVFAEINLTCSSPVEFRGQEMTQLDLAEQCKHRGLAPYKIAIICITLIIGLAVAIFCIVRYRRKIEVLLLNKCGITVRKNLDEQLRYHLMDH